MSTKSQLKEMFSAVLKAHPKARYIDGRIYLRPISQVAWIIALGTTSLPDMYHLSWGPTALFVPGNLYGSLRFPIMIPNPKAPAADGIHERVLQATEEQCLSRIPAEPTLDDLYKSGDTQRGRVRYNAFNETLIRGVFYYSAQGLMDHALDMSTRLIAIAEQYPLEKLDLSFQVATRDLHPLLLAGDRKGIGDLLRQHEHRSVVSRKIEKFREPAPYPVELQA